LTYPPPQTPLPPSRPTQGGAARRSGGAQRTPQGPGGGPSPPPGSAQRGVERGGFLYIPLGGHDLAGRNAPGHPLGISRAAKGVRAGTA